MLRRLRAGGRGYPFCMKTPGEDKNRGRVELGEVPDEEDIGPADAAGQVDEEPDEQVNLTERDPEAAAEQRRKM